MIRDRAGCPVAELSGGALASLCCVLFIIYALYCTTNFRICQGCPVTLKAVATSASLKAGQAGAAGEESETVLRIFAFAIAFPAVICYNAQERRREGARDGAGKDDTV